MNRPLITTILILTLILFTTHSFATTSSAELRIKALAKRDQSNREFGSGALIITGGAFLIPALSPNQSSMKDSFLASGASMLGLGVLMQFNKYPAELEAQLVDAQPTDEERKKAAEIALKRLSDNGFQQRMLSAGGYVLGGLFTYSAMQSLTSSAGNYRVDPSAVLTIDGLLALFYLCVPSEYEKEYQNHLSETKPK